MSAADAQDLTRVDLSPAAFADGLPHETFAALRRQAPVCWIGGSEPGSGFWALSKAEDIRAVSRDPGRFSSYRGGVFLENDEVFPLEIAREIIIFMDPPKHVRFRRIVARGFTPRATTRLEPIVRRVVNSVIDRVCERGECDFVADVASKIPLQVIAEMIGIPEEEWPRVEPWIETAVEFGDPESSSLEARLQAASEGFAYAGELARERQRCPADDLITALMNAEIDGEALSESEFGLFFLFLLTAGTETSRNVLAGGAKALIEYPAQRRRLEQDPSLFDSAAEELLRWVTPITYFRRTATCATVIRGTEISEGDKVVMWYASANFDEDLYDDPLSLDVARKIDEQFSFGAVGPHLCLGASLARAELRIAFEEIVRRMPDLALAGPVRRVWSNWMQGLKSMPVTFTPTRSTGARS